MVAAQLDALQRNDWPDSDAGVRAAFDFSKPRDAEQLLPGQARCCTYCRILTGVRNVCRRRVRASLKGRFHGFAFILIFVHVYRYEPMSSRWRRGAAQTGGSASASSPTCSTRRPTRCCSTATAGRYGTRRKKKDFHLGSFLMQ